MTLHSTSTQAGAKPAAEGPRESLVRQAAEAIDAFYDAAAAGKADLAPEHQSAAAQTHRAHQLGITDVEITTARRNGGMVTLYVGRHRLSGAASQPRLCEADARAFCEEQVRRDEQDAPLEWSPDPEGECPRELFTEDDRGDLRETGYSIQPVSVLLVFDPGPPAQHGV
ncbi:hypothetical protein ABR737_00960 [Streptomyces sp. Edi2]|uniref:hypothetical protein n=1 Tax=Streptomyces sp. Edi2 TaxID=3162528 RepID=UPI0033066BC4